MDENPQPDLTSAEAEIVVEAPPPPPPPAARSVVRDAVLDLVASFLSAIGLGIFVGVIASISGVWNWGDFEKTAATVPGIAFLLAVGEIPMLVFAIRRLRRNRIKGRNPVTLFAGNPARAVIWGMAAGLALTVTSAVYSLAMQRILGDDVIPKQLDFMEQLRNDRAGMAILTLIIAGLAPVCEEMLFRGAIFGSARTIGHARTGAIVSAILFAIVHLSPILAPFYIVFALVMCWLFVRTGTLAAPIAAHMTQNGLACLAVIFGPAQ